MSFHVDPIKQWDCLLAELAGPSHFICSARRQIVTLIGPNGAGAIHQRENGAGHEKPTEGKCQRKPAKRGPKPWLAIDLTMPMSADASCVDQPPERSNSTGINRRWSDPALTPPSD